MPTGYTADVATGKIMDFKEYALQCARAFGACIMLRDEPMSSDIPEFKASTHNRAALKKAQDDLSKFDAMTPEQQKQKHKKEMASKAKYARDMITEVALQRARYEDMLSEARKFKAPSEEHKEYAAFLVSQLVESIKFDCRTDCYEKEIGEAELIGFSLWRLEHRRALLRDIEYHEKAQREENERTEKRNLWVLQLKQSLGMEVQK